MNGNPKPCPAHTFNKGVINGPDPSTERGRRRRQKAIAAGVQFTIPRSKTV